MLFLVEFHPASPSQGPLTFNQGLLVQLFYRRTKQALEMFGEIHPILFLFGGNSVIYSTFTFQKMEMCV